MNTCKYCQSENLEQRIKTPHIGLWCLDCGKFQTWIKQNTETGEIATDKQHDYARYLLNKWRDSKTKFLASEAGAIIKALKPRFGGQDK